MSYDNADYVIWARGRKLLDLPHSKAYFLRLNEWEPTPTQLQTMRKELERMATQAVQS